MSVNVYAKKQIFWGKMGINVLQRSRQQSRILFHSVEHGSNMTVKEFPHSRYITSEFKDKKSCLLIKHPVLFHFEYHYYRCLSR